MYDFAPGTEWPEVDVHEGEERYYVVSGEFIDRGHRLGPGSYVVFAPTIPPPPRQPSLERARTVVGNN